jgi:hypothetical protein
MKPYFVTWEIDVWAEDPIDAARQALEIQLTNQTAVVFKVHDESGGGPWTIDLLEEDEKENVSRET